MTLLFISDLHLSRERPAITRAFFHFLDQKAKTADALYILGDLFEAWIGDDDPEPLARQAVAALRELTDSGVPVYFLHGNRDFLIGSRFARETGCTLLGDYHVLEVDDQRILLCHGDTLCTEDKDYQKFRRKVRNPFYRWLLAHLPLKRRQRIARDWRARSMAANANKAENIMDVTESEVNAALSAHKAQILIHGHTHRPGVHSHEQGDRVVLGDWESRGWYIRIEGDQLDLIDFVINEPAERTETTTPDSRESNSHGDNRQASEPALPTRDETSSDFRLTPFEPVESAEVPGEPPEDGQANCQIQDTDHNSPQTLIRATADRLLRGEANRPERQLTLDL